MENKSLKREFVSKDKNVGAKRRKVTTVEKNISPNLSDQKMAMMKELMQNIQPMVTDIMTNLITSFIAPIMTNQLLNNRSTRKSKGDEGDVSIIPSPEVETIDIIDVKEEISIKNEPENPIVIIDEDEESIKNELTLEQPSKIQVISRRRLLLRMILIILLKLLTIVEKVLRMSQKKLFRSKE